MTPPKAVQESSAQANILSEADKFANFFSSNHLSVFRYIYAIHGHPQETVEDLTAETFLRAWRARRSFSGDDNAALRWILRIARNLVIDTYRRASWGQDPDDINEHYLASEEFRAGGTYGSLRGSRPPFERDPDPPGRPKGDDHLTVCIGLACKRYRGTAGYVGKHSICKFEASAGGHA